MPAYVIAHLRAAAPHPEIAECIERLSATFEPHGGRYLVHAAQHEVMEGGWPGHVAPLRSRHIAGDIILVDGVPEDYDPTAAVKAMREALPAE